MPAIPIDQVLQNAIKERARAKLADSPVKRSSRLTRPSDCSVCGKPIRPGEMYLDAGRHNRAHDACVPPF
jgi:hypothetical protein